MEWSHSMHTVLGTRHGGARRALLLRGCRIAGEAAAADERDILVGEDGRIASIGHRLEVGPDVIGVDLRGALVSPGFVDVHQHLDKTGVLKFTPNPSGTLQGAREAFARYARQAPEDDVTRRAARTMERCLARGTTAIRSHINVDKDAGFNGINALARLRSEWADRLTLQLVAFMTPHPNQDIEWLEKNIDAAVEQADALGGTPAVAEDPMRYLDILFAAAERHGRPIDLHLDEHLSPERPLFDAVFERVRRFGLQGRTVLGHASVLSALPRKEFERIRDQMIDLDIAVVTLPAANLYLQGRSHDMLPPRGLTRVAELIRAGVAIATASDNIQDPFVPTGSGDMLEIARWTLLAGHLRGDELATAYDMITAIPARMMNLTDYGIREGTWADLVVTDCEDVSALVGGGPDCIQVLAKGRPVAAPASPAVEAIRALEDVP
ncbi:amidohydrolase family protein [Sinorhizobium meliloti]|nr:amidohydrolase family protein [Sinorhizobium meliloti]MDW9603576.1 amidohydrolase family protein [Sinorhizobium meliloti]MDW9671406.1 amidohydrolase family protein [Sinorhizobium meliloti]MDW9950326.1 amidohydrolase family protein [Sinorhizobium meliloti]MDX0385124.1 amidohydrolase family protein [Sinorhizobium meliloti]